MEKLVATHYLAIEPKRGSAYPSRTLDFSAKRVFDFGVNAGAGTAVKTLQQALNALGGTLTADGGWGPVTLAAANSADPAALVQAFIRARVAHYEAIAAANPADAAYLKGWLKRAQS